MTKLRIAIVNWTSRRIGGTESYLHSLVPALVKEGYELGVWCETDQPTTESPIYLPGETPFWCAANGGSTRALQEMTAWKPDLLYCHGMQDPQLEESVQRVAPGVFFVHNYYGTCISGRKTRCFPEVRPCERKFGAGCLACYFPRRCGGLNPVTAWTEYRRQARRLRLLSGYRLLLTHSDHMRQEYVRHGLQSEKVAYYASTQSGYAECQPISVPPEAWQLLFLGRFDPMKGGERLLDALPQVLQRLQRPLNLTMAGDGPCRAEWEAQAKRIQQKWPTVRVDFPGWVSPEERDRLLARTHLLVAPSLWPEPFGRIGPEAGSAGVPVVAFDVGGVRAWLTAGENGFVAPGNPATAKGLADAIVRALTDVSTYRRLSTRAKELAARFTMVNHLEELRPIFARACRT